MKSHEIALLILVMENQLSSDDTTSLYSLKNEMNKSGYTDIAASVGIRALVKHKMIETFREADYQNNEYMVCRLTEKGENWILSNQDQLVFRKSSEGANGDDLPF